MHEGAGHLKRIIFSANNNKIKKTPNFNEFYSSLNKKYEIGYSLEEKVFGLIKIKLPVNLNLANIIISPDNWKKNIYQNLLK